MTIFICRLTDCTGKRFSDVFNRVVSEHGEELTRTCGITPTSEHQLEDFGIGSAWLFEAGFKISVEFSGRDTVVTVSR